MLKNERLKTQLSKKGDFNPDWRRRKIVFYFLLCYPSSSLSSFRDGSSPNAQLRFFAEPWCAGVGGNNNNRLLSRAPLYAMEKCASRLKAELTVLFFSSFISFWFSSVFQFHVDAVNRPESRLFQTRRHPLGSSAVTHSTMASWAWLLRCAVYNKQRSLLHHSTPILYIHYRKHDCCWFFLNSRLTQLIIIANNGQRDIYFPFTSLETNLRKK